MTLPQDTYFLFVFPIGLSQVLPDVALLIQTQPWLAGTKQDSIEQMQHAITGVTLEQTGASQSVLPGFICSTAASANLRTSKHSAYMS